MEAARQGDPLMVSLANIRDVNRQGYFDWWLAEISGVLGTDGVARNLPARCIIAHYEGDSIDFYRLVRRDAEHLGRIRGIGENEMVLGHGASTLFETIEQTGLPVILRLGSDRALFCQDVLPAAARSDLRAIVANKLDMLTPWSDEQTYFDVCPSRKRGADLLEVEIAVTPKQRLDQSLKALKRLGISVAAVDIVEDEATSPPRFDLLAPYNDGPKHPTLLRSLTLAVLVIALLGMGVAGYQIWQGQLDLNDQRQRIASLKAQTADLPELRQQIDTLTAENIFVATRQMDRPSVLLAVEALSRLLPDDVWLQSVVLDGYRLTLSGFASRASALPPLINDDPNFSNVQFRAPSTMVDQVVGDRLVEVDQFSLAADIVSRREAQF